MQKKRSNKIKSLLLVVAVLVLGISTTAMAKDQYGTTQGIVISVNEPIRQVTLLPLGKSNKPENYVVLTLEPNAVIKFSQGQQTADFASLRPGVVIRATHSKAADKSMVNYITILQSKSGTEKATQQVETTTKAPEVTTTQPETTSTQPVETTTQAPEITTTAPVETTTAPEETTTQVPEITTTAPEETTTQVPEVTAAPEETTEKAPEVTTKPAQTEKPHQIVKDNTLKGVCIIKVYKDRKEIVVAPLEGIADQHRQVIVHVKDDTKITKLRGNKVCRFKDLRRGQKVNILTDGIIIPSKPRETTALEIMILNK